MLIATLFAPCASQARGLFARSLHLLLFMISMTTQSRAQQTFFPGSVPLVARSTYMSCWVGTQLYSQRWPITPSAPYAILGWAGLVKIDNTTYSWLGDPQHGLASNVSRFSVTPTRTVFTLLAPPMELNITFLSPIEPGDFVKQSIPFSYVTFEATSLDGASHSVEVYADLSGEWISGDRNQRISWNTYPDPSSLGPSNVTYHSAALENGQVFNDSNGQAQWGTLYHATKLDSTTTWKIGSDTDSRGQFANQSFLDDGDTDYRVITFEWPVFAISKKLGTIYSTSSPVVWAVGFARDPAVMYTDVSGAQQPRHLYYQSTYSANLTTVLIEDFLDDFPAALQRADALDAKVLNAAATLMPGSDYSDLLSISTRQVYASTELTIGTNADGTFDTSDVMMFMRDTGGGDSKRTNAVEILYAAFPTFMYIDPPLGGALLEPLLRIQNTSAFQLPYAAMDLTSAYPNVTVSTSRHSQGVEQSGNMIIMVYAYSRASGDGSLIARYYPLLKKWSDYLVSNTVILSNQTSSDSVTTNQTNLAIKGIIAVQAMSCISSALGRTTDANIYSTQAKTLYSNWTSLALGGGQTLLAAYGHQSTWTIGYNLFADRWLGTDIVDSTIFAAQESSLLNLLQTLGGTNFGLAVDSTNTNVVTSSWDMFAVAMMNDSDARSTLVARIHNQASQNTSSGAFPLMWTSGESQPAGLTVSGVASPAQGAVYAPLALTIQNQAINTSGFISSDPPPRRRSSNAGAIAGGVIGSLGGVAVLGALAYWIWRRRKYQFSRTDIDLVTDDVHRRPQPREVQFERLSGLAVGADERYNVPSQRDGGGGAGAPRSSDPNSRSLDPQPCAGESSSESTPGHVTPFSLWMNGQMRETEHPPVAPQGPGLQTDEPHVPGQRFLSTKAILQLRAMNSYSAGQDERAPLEDPPASQMNGAPPTQMIETPPTQVDGNQSALRRRQLREEVTNVVQELFGERMELPPSYNEDAEARGSPLA